MSTTHLQRSLAALVTIAGCLIATATPAAAAVHDVDITGGSIFLAKPSVSEELQALGSSCTTPSTLSIDLGTETSGANVSVTALSSSHVEPYSNGSFLTVLTRSAVGSSAGTLTSSTSDHGIANVKVGVVARIYDTNGCGSATLLCTVGLVLDLSGTSTSTTSGNTISLTGTSVGTVTVFPTCTGGPTQILGTTATATINGTLTT